MTHLFRFKKLLIKSKLLVNLTIWSNGKVMGLIKIHGNQHDISIMLKKNCKNGNIINQNRSTIWNIINWLIKFNSINNIKRRLKNLIIQEDKKKEQFLESKLRNLIKLCQLQLFKIKSDQFLKKFNQKDKLKNKKTKERKNN